ncbi:MAG TPA: class I SAM-dependent methyltransferase [Anaerolineales bacterium]|nr:class I SAM-dependent methyltransferase [Anaerolineales bacterium]
MSAPSPRFACPRCHSALSSLAADELLCPDEGSLYRREAGIWRFLLPERAAAFERFTREYETVRRGEGRGSEDAAYYRALPFEDQTGRFSRDWEIRSRSYAAFERRLLEPLEQRLARPLLALDLGAGNGWLANRLAQRGHAVAAVDLLTNDLDGLGAYRHYSSEYTSVQAEFERLPFEDGQFDLAIYNASFHYSVSYEAALRESLRVLRREGRVAILDTPIYRRPSSGEQMVREREAQFQETFGFPSNAIPSENYLTFQRLRALSRALAIEWEMIVPFYGLRWAARTWRARLLRRREPARFLILVGQHPRA